MTAGFRSLLGTTSKILRLLRPLTNVQQWQQQTEESYPEPAVQHSMYYTTAVLTITYYVLRTYLLSREIP